MKKFATFDKESKPAAKAEVDKILAGPPSFPLPGAAPQSVGLRLGYTINLNLPATTDVAVFNAIFKSLKEHLLEAPNENR